MKIIDHRSLPEDRLATNDESGWRVYIYPAWVQGFWRNWRTVTQVLLIAIFLLLPWVQIGGHQAVLLDIPRRQFALFGLTFWAHDTPILFFVALFLVIMLAFVTAIWGRIWCGWACPQTVFIDGVFRRIERWVIGTHIEQIQLARSPLSIRKFLKYSLKWLLFIIVGLVISHSFLAFFVGTDRLAEMISSPPQENWTAFLVMSFVAAVVIFDFGWFREQFCIIMCPYGRLQSALMDQSSLAIMYDEKRGEPRGKLSTVPKGDCIDCFKCVAVCPTGIDIRRGVQMECIACTACVDACDEVMTKINKPKGLIRYSSFAEMAGKVRHTLTPRLFIYLFLIAVSLIGLIVSVRARAPIDVSVLRGIDAPYTVLEEGEYKGQVLNHFKLHIKNQEFHEVDVGYELVVSDLSAQPQIVLVSPMNPVHLKPGELQRVPFFVRLPKELTRGLGRYEIKLRARATGAMQFETIKELKLVGPFE